MLVGTVTLQYISSQQETHTCEQDDRDVIVGSCNVKVVIEQEQRVIPGVHAETASVATISSDLK